MTASWARGGVALFFVLIALPIALLGLSLASEWSAILSTQRQAANVAELAATAAAAATDPDAPYRIEPSLAQEAAEQLLAKAVSPVDFPGGQTRMLSPARGVRPAVALSFSPDLTVATATVSFSLPAYPVLDTLSTLFGYGRYEIDSQASASSAICFTGVEEERQTSAGCRFLQVG